MGKQLHLTDSELVALRNTAAALALDSLAGTDTDLEVVLSRAAEFEHFLTCGADEDDSDG